MTGGRKCNRIREDKNSKKEVLSKSKPKLKPKFMSKRNLIIGIVILTAVVLAGGVFWFWQNNGGQEKGREIRRKPELTDQDRAKMQVEIDKLHENPLDMSNWKTYRNEKYGFEVKYPENWVYTERFYKRGDRGVSFLFGEKECGRKYESEGVEYCDNLARISVYEDVIEKKEERKMFWEIEKYEYGGTIAALNFSEELLGIKRRDYRNNSFGYTFDIYRFVNNALGYKLIIKHKNPDYNPTTERTILESFKFINKKN